MLDAFTDIPYRMHQERMLATKHPCIECYVLQKISKPDRHAALMGVPV